MLEKLMDFINLSSPEEILSLLKEYKVPLTKIGYNNTIRFTKNAFNIMSLSLSYNNDKNEFKHYNISIRNNINKNIYYTKNDTFIAKDSIKKYSSYTLQEAKVKYGGAA